MLVDQRIALLVDSENLEITANQYYEPAPSEKRTHKVYPDWTTIVPRVVANRKLVRNVYYKRRASKVSQKFRRLWQEDLFGEIKTPVKSVDPYIIVDAITLAEKVDSVVLLAGDKDYLPLIWFLRSKGCKVEMASFSQAAASEVKAAADFFHALDESDTIVLPLKRGQ